ncbi:futalosine hydrolase [Pseudofrankia inefficax]|uniref:Futalosine hydrolase n=1 Tax=Pseudofrankia inefficax (strain DSM 45817 / CECT 9037 / DDB 130130 / EuI1c) TaxID=298654 RepID=E3J3I5_PSEI1|nr:futalosine hydrolase [Pseudofrankia inefficax]ADP78187.1 futalosine nucleosidase [Pseudofrankia inefficax]
MSRTLIVTAVQAEADAVCAGLMGSWSRSRGPSSEVPSAPVSPDWDRQLLTTSTLGPYVGRRRGPVTVLAAGTGGPAAAAGTAVALAVAAATGDPFTLVLSMGVAGGFRGWAEVGDLAVASRLVAADLGAESGLEDLREPAGKVHEMDRSLGFHSTGAPPLPRATSSSADGKFLTLDDLDLGSSTIIPKSGLVERLATVVGITGRRVVTGPVLSVATVTGTELRAATLTARLDPVAEGMEGYAVGTAAAAFGVPAGEIRAISNQVGRRDRASWNLPAALASLRTAAGALVAHPDGLLAAAADASAADGSRPPVGR